MENFNTNFKDLYQCAQDLIELGVITNQEDYLKFFHTNTSDGDELEIAQKLVDDYCFGGKNDESLLDENELKQVNMLYRIYPNYKFTDIRKLYKMINGKFKSKMQMILSILSMHNKMENQLLPEENNLIHKHPLNSNIPIESNDSDTFNEAFFQKICRPFADNRTTNMSIDSNDVTSSTIQPSCTYRNTSTDFHGLPVKSTVTATVVRPEMPVKENDPISPHNFLEFPFERINQIGKVTCKPMESLVQSSSDDFKLPPPCKQVTNNSFFDLLDDKGAEVSENNQMDPPIPITLPMEVEANMFQTNNEPIGGLTKENIYQHNLLERGRSVGSPGRYIDSTISSMEPIGGLTKENIYQHNLNERGKFVGNPGGYIDSTISSMEPRGGLTKENIYQHNLFKPRRFIANPGRCVDSTISSMEAMPHLQAIGSKHKTLEETEELTENKKQKLDPTVFRDEKNHDESSSDYNSDIEDERNLLREINEMRHLKSCKPYCKCYERNRRKSILKPARFQPDEPIDLSELSENNDLLTDHSDDEMGAVAMPEPKRNRAESSYCSKLSSHIMEMFPDACPTYVKNLCIGKKKTEEHISQILEIIFNDPNYPKRTPRSPTPPAEMDLETQTQLLKDILPDADPTYLESKALIYLSQPDGLREFISSSLERRGYPTKKEYLRRQQLNAQVRQYTTEFNVDKFLDIIPDPETYFNDQSRRTRSADHIERHLCGLVLKNLYPRVAVRDIPSSLYDQNLMIAAEYLNNAKTMKSIRKPVYVDLSALQNIPLLQEIAYLTNHGSILKRVEDKKRLEAAEREEAKANGSMMTCSCCYDEEVMSKESVTCENGCIFCKRCVKTSVQIAFNEGKSDFPCLAGCTINLSLKTLKDALDPKFFSKVAQRQQLQEVKAAGIDDVVTCPFCDFATIPAPGDKIFKCLNTECMKESCLECKEPSHVPLRCDEIEKDDDVKKRTYIENKMTEALVRVCYKCGMKFIKEDGCNKMTCSCGAMMCYVCSAPVKDYKHFNGQGGDKYHLCPLYSDTNTMHENQVVQGAEMAREELGIAKDDKLKVDPLDDVHHHYDRRRREAPPVPGEPRAVEDPQARFHMVVNIVGHGVRPHMIRINHNRRQHRRGHPRNNP